MSGWQKRQPEKSECAWRAFSSGPILPGRPRKSAANERESTRIKSKPKIKLKRISLFVLVLLLIRVDSHSFAADFLSCLSVRFLFLVHGRVGIPDNVVQALSRLPVCQAYRACHRDPDLALTRFQPIIAKDPLAQTFDLSPGAVRSAIQDDHKFIAAPAPR